MTRRVARIVATVASSATAARAPAIAMRSPGPGRSTPSARGSLREYAPQHRARPRVHHPRSRGFRRPASTSCATSSASRARETRFPTKATCLAIYSRVVNAQAALDEVLGARFPWCADWEAELRRLFAAYVEAKQRQHVLDYDDLLLYWAHMMAEPALARRGRRPLRSRAGRRIPGHQSRCRRRSCWRSSPTAEGSPWSATTRSRSTRSAPRPCATFSTFPVTSARPPRSSRSSATTARRRRSSTRPTR